MKAKPTVNEHFFYNQWHVLIRKISSQNKRPCHARDLKQTSAFLKQNFCSNSLSSILDLSRNRGQLLSESFLNKLIQKCLPLPFI